MLRKFKHWLVDTFLPAWAKESVYRENEALKAEIAQLKIRLGEQEAYIDGLRDCIRNQRRVVIRNEVKK